MAEYIEREALLVAYDKAHVGPPGRARKLIEEAPAAEVAPVVHGRWNLNKHYGDYECSVCKQGDVTIVHRDLLKLNYRPNCGARMDGE